LVADLVERRAAVIGALGPPAVVAAKARAPSTPIVFITGADRSNSASSKASAAREEI
jgi:hypothetical protein